VNFYRESVAQKMKKIFVTGATGFLGHELIHDLVREGHYLVLLCRDTQSRKVKERIEYWNRSSFAHQIEWVEGNLHAPFLGISRDVISRLKGQITVVYHLAALVKFDFSLEEELTTTNLIGTGHVLDFAEQVGASQFYYVSTAYTLGSSDVGQEKLYDLDRSFLNPYEKTKCLAEHKVMGMEGRFEHIGIFRPAIIVGNSLTGEALSQFTLYGFIRGLEVFKKRLIKMRVWGKETIFLHGDPEGTSNFVPVDYVSRVLNAVLKSPIKSGIFHITNPVPPKNGMIFSLIKEILDIKHINLRNLQKYPLTEPHKWQEFLQSLVEVYKLYLHRNIRFEDGQTNRLLLSVGQTPLNMSEDMLRRIILGYRQPVTN
jgi:nucleoside-diphosphate-sugar epimerase